MAGIALRAGGDDGLTPTGRVPVEHRVFGLDRCTLLPGLAVVGVFLLWTVVLPLVNSALSYSQETESGDVFELGPGLTMDAQPGWDVDSGLLTSQKTRTQARDRPVVLASGGASFVVEPGPFQGTARQLLRQIEKVDSAMSGNKTYHVSSRVATSHTNDGHRGVAQAYTTVDGTGVVTALVYGDTGLKIAFTGSSVSMQDQGEQVGKMIDSIHYDRKAADR